MPVKSIVTAFPCLRVFAFMSAISAALVTSAAEASGTCTIFRELRAGAMPSGELVTCETGASDIVIVPRQPAGRVEERWRLMVQLRNAGGVLVYNPRIAIACGGASPSLGATWSAPSGVSGLGPGETSAPFAIEAACAEGAPVTFSVLTGPRVLRVIGKHGSAQGELSKPHGLAVLDDGSLVVADRGNNRLQVFDAQGAFVRTWGSIGHRRSELDHPEDVAVSPSSQLAYVCDMNNAAVKVFDLEGRLRRVIVGPRGNEMDHPSDLALSPDGATIYVADQGHFRICRFTATGKWQGSWGTFGEGPGQFRSLLDVETASDGRVFVTDAANRNVQAFDSAGKWLITIDGSRTDQEHLTYPSAVVPLGAHHVLVADFSLDRVLALGLDGSFKGWFGRNADTPGALHYPNDLRLVGSRLFVAETASDTVTVFELAQWEVFQAIPRN